ncbi:MAG: alpha-L-fucosidase [Candidatus Latescibacterota bacterium]
MTETTAPAVPDKWRWFPQSRFGLFIHWGPYAALGRGEQVANRENIDHREYARLACLWNPRYYDARAWADVAVRAGMKYAVLTARHHDGYCLWDTATTDYSSARQAPGRDFVAEYVEAFRQAGLRTGLYYSVADFRIPGYWARVEDDPEGFARFGDYVHAQVRELLCNYGRIDVMWFDKAEHHSALEWRAPELVEMMRRLQPEILINQRLGEVPADSIPEDERQAGAGPARGGSPTVRLGDFANSEHSTRAHPGMLWESCLVPTWRLWGYAVGERWKPVDQLLDSLVEVVSRRGNLLLNVGPDGEGRIPHQFVALAEEVGRWLEVHGECIYGAEGGGLTEFITYGHQIVKGNALYLVIRHWDRRPTLRLAGLATPVKRAELLTSGQPLTFAQGDGELVLCGLPAEPPTSLFPVIRLECEGPPQAESWAHGPYYGTVEHALDMALRRGPSVWADGRER